MSKYYNASRRPTSKYMCVLWSNTRVSQTENGLTDRRTDTKRAKLAPCIHNLTVRILTSTNGHFIIYTYNSQIDCHNCARTQKLADSKLPACNRRCAWQSGMQKKSYILPFIVLFSCENFQWKQFTDFSMVQSIKRRYLNC